MSVELTGVLLSLRCSRRWKRCWSRVRRPSCISLTLRFLERSFDACSPDEDLAAMYLSDKKAGTPRIISNHEELEVLLESFSKQVEEIVNETDTTIVRQLSWFSSHHTRGHANKSCGGILYSQSNVQSTQEIVELVLDSNRNALLALDLKVGIDCTDGP